MIKKRRTKRVFSRKGGTRNGGMSGITVKEGMDPTQAINFFIDHSTIKYLSKGSNGATFVATLHTGMKSPYKSTDADTYGNDVQHLLLKLIIFKISNDNVISTDRIRFKYEHQDKHHTLSFVLESEIDFHKEIERQNEVYIKTMDYLEPICPAIVFSNIYRDTKTSGVLNKLLTNSLVSDEAHAMLNSIHLSSHMFESIGIIGMEFAEDYYTLSDWREHVKSTPGVLSRGKPDDMYNNIGLYLILELALKTGYSHTDFHGLNIMMKNISKDSYPYFLQGFPIKPLFIDFGLAVKITRDKYVHIQELCNNGEYVKALSVICTIPRRDGVRLNTSDAERLYGWACKPENENTTNQIIAILFKQREAAKQHIMTVFNKQQLPLSDSSKREVIKESGATLSEDNTSEESVSSHGDNLLDLIEMPDEKYTRKSPTRKSPTRKSPTRK